jgi:hypothetical protein
MSDTIKERGIMFSADMVRALLDGRKTQTRRIVKGVFKSEVYKLYGSGLEAIDCIKDWDGGPSRLDFAPDDWEICPYGKPGDRLWVRETFNKSPDGIIYRATQEEAGSLEPGDSVQWTSPIFMPHWASRITLEITHVRVQRVQEISEDDAEAEGVGCAEGYRNRLLYYGLWDSINGKRPGCAWMDNPWVWAISFVPSLPREMTGGRKGWQCVV